MCERSWFRSPPGPFFTEPPGVQTFPSRLKIKIWNEHYFFSILDVWRKIPIAMLQIETTLGKLVSSIDVNPRHIDKKNYCTSWVRFLKLYGYCRYWWIIHPSSRCQFQYQSVSSLLGILVPKKTAWWVDTFAWHHTCPSWHNTSSWKHLVHSLMIVSRRRDSLSQREATKRTVRLT